MPETDQPENTPREPAQAAGNAPPPAPATLAEVDRVTKRLLGKQGPFRASVRLLKLPCGHKFVAKDYRACTPLYRWTVGRWNLAREARAQLGHAVPRRAVQRIHGRAYGTQDQVESRSQSSSSWVQIQSSLRRPTSILAMPCMPGRSSARGSSRTASARK